MNVFDRAECFLPQFELDGCIELRKTGIKMVLKRIWVGKVDGMRLMRVLGDVRQVKTKSFAKSSKLNFALMFKAKLESLACDMLTGSKPILLHKSS